MPIYHYLDMDCVPRSELGGTELVRQVQSAVLADRLDARFEEAGEGSLPDSEKTFDERKVTSAGEQHTEKRSVDDLRRASEALKPLALHCDGCPATLTGGDFGCVHSITLPLSEVSERWLVKRAGPPESLAGQLLRATIEQMNLGQCELLDQWRTSGLLQSERPKAIDIDDHEAGEALAVTSDHLLHFLFMSGDIEPTRALSALLFLRALSTDTDQELGTDTVIRLIHAFQMGGGEGSLPEFVFTAPPQLSDDPSVFELKTFLFALFRAFQLGVPVRLLTSL